MKDELPEAVIRRAQEGDERAFERILDRYEPLLCAVVARHFARPQDQEDALAEVHLALVESLPSYAFQARFSTWLYGLAHRTCLRLRRDEQRACLAQGAQTPNPDREREPEYAGMLSPEAQWEAEQRREKLQQALERLNGDYREVIRWRLEEGLSVEETAKLMGKSYTAVTTLLYRALKALRAYLQEEPNKGGDRSD